LLKSDYPNIGTFVRKTDAEQKKITKGLSSGSSSTSINNLDRNEEADRDEEFNLITQKTA